MKRSSYFLKNTILFAVSNVASKFIVFLLIPLYTNMLSTQEYGVLDLVTTLATVAVPVFTCNINEAIMRFSLDKGVKHNDIMSIGLIFTAICAVLSFSLVPLSSLSPQLYEYRFYIYFYAVSVGVNQIAICGLRGRELLTEFMIVNILSSFSAAFLNIVMLVFFDLGIKGYFAAYIVTNCISILFSFYKIKIGGTIRNFYVDFQLMYDMARYAIVLVPNSFMWWIMNSSDRLMVTSMLGMDANGLYAISYKIPTILSVITAIFNQAWIYSAIKEEESSDKVAFSNQMYGILVRGLTLGTAFVLVVLKCFMQIYVGEAFYNAWKYTPVLLIGFYFMALGTFLSTSYTVNKDSGGFLFSGTVGAVVNVILNLILIPNVGVMGAATATCISYIFVFAYRCFDTRRYIRLDIFNYKYVLYVFMIIVMVFTLFIEDKVISSWMVCEFLILVFLLRTFISGITKQVLFTIKTRLDRK